MSAAAENTHLGDLPYEYEHTPEQQEMYDKFLAENRPKCPTDPALAYIYNDEWIHRFLVARKWDYDAAVKQLEDSLAWRKSFGADTIINQPPDPIFDKYILRGLHGCARNGFEVLWERPGLSLYDKAVSKVGVEACVRSKVFNREVQRKYCHESEKKFRMIVVFDVKGLSLSIATKQTWEFARQLGVVDSQNYPEQLEKAIIINASWVFTKLWSVGKSFVDPHTQKKVVVLGSDYMDKLQEYIAPENIPRFAGGKCCGEGCPYVSLGALRCGEEKPVFAVEGDFEKVTVKAGKTKDMAVEVPHAKALVTVRAITSKAGLKLSLWIGDTDGPSRCVLEPRHIAGESSDPCCIEYHCTERGHVWARFHNNNTFMAESLSVDFLVVEVSDELSALATAEPEGEAEGEAAPAPVE